MNNDLSNEAFWEWLEQTGYAKSGLEAWQEAARRALERERQAFEAGFLARNLKNWNSIEAYSAYREGQNDRGPTPNAK